MSITVWPLDREPYHGDIVQGRLGNCFFIASLQALASCQPQILKSIISASPLKCYFYRRGERVEIPVAVEPITDEYQYCHSTVTDIQWPYIIEQAYTQFYGGRYENLAGGNTSEAFYDLLGKPVEEIEPNDNEIWDKIEKGLAEKNILVTCGSVVTNNAATTNITNGLVVNHAYAILATFVYRQTREKYVLIHNPQGINHILKENSRVRNAFFTSISKTHPLWARTPGTQLLSWTELKRSCNRIQVCHLNVESRQLLSGDWSPMTCGGCSNFSTFYRNPFILFSSSFSKNTILVLGHTIDQRHERAETSLKLDYPQLGVTIIQLKSNTVPTHDNYEVICQSKFWNKREVTLPIDMNCRQEKQYAAVLSTYCPEIKSAFWLQVFSRQPLPTVTLQVWTNLFQQTVQTIQGKWHRENAGGRQNKSNPLTFYKNPAYLLTLSDTCFVRLILHQSFANLVPLSQHHPIGIYVLSTTTNEEPAFIRARSVSRLLSLNSEEQYYVIPACLEANCFGEFELDVLCDVPFTLDPVERKAPVPPPEEDKTSIPTDVAGTVVSNVEKPVTKAASTRTTRTKDLSNRQNISTNRTLLSTLIDEYSKKV